MKILYLGDMTPHTNSWRRANTLRRMGHELTCYDLENKLTKANSPLVSRLHYWTGYRVIQPRLPAALEKTVGDERFDVAWINGGAIYGPAALKWIRTRANRLINYNNDDPTGPRDWHRWATFRKAISEYDLCVVLRSPNVAEYYSYGAKQVFRTYMSYDETEIAPRVLSEKEQKQWASQVLFVGTWMPGRGSFLAELIERGVPLTIYGGRWDRSPEWPRLKKAWRAGPVIGPSYVAALQCAKICLGMVSHGNRDEHTLRSFEIPFIGPLLLAERTGEHFLFFDEDRDAVFWSSAKECAEKCHALLADEPRRQAIADAGHRRVLSLRVTHKEILAETLRLAISDEWHGRHVRIR